jgi:hypothetical protein
MSTRDRLTASVAIERAWNPLARSISDGLVHHAPCITLSETSSPLDGCRQSDDGHVVTTAAPPAREWARSPLNPAARDSFGSRIARKWVRFEKLPSENRPHPIPQKL